jgi:hypothetical protein
MSALGQKQTFAVQNAMSALLPIADMCDAKRDVRFVPIADIAVPDLDRDPQRLSLAFIITRSISWAVDLLARAAQSVWKPSLYTPADPFR